MKILLDDVGSWAPLFAAALALPGAVISLYFASVYHRLLAPVERFFPRFCRIEPATCSRVLEAKQARVFGIPNFYLGIGYYSGIIMPAFFPTAWREVHLILQTASLLAVFSGVYLSYVLVFRLRITCTLCFTCHALNSVIFLILLVAP